MRHAPAVSTTVSTWVFDLDNTLYPPRLSAVRPDRGQDDGLGDARAEGITRRGRPLAPALLADSYGTTLAGLMAEHDIDPGPYLAEVHDIDFSPTCRPIPIWPRASRDLPGRRIVYTNACEPYAHRVLEARGLSGLFDAIYGVEHAGFHPKPDRAAFEKVFATDGLDPTRAAMFEDDRAQSEGAPCPGHAHRSCRSRCGARGSHPPPHR
jgi:putative hydrolase of the HAD superfamily